MKKSTKQKSILFLSHQGYSFIDDLISIAKMRGLAPCVLSSRPTAQNRYRIDTIRESSAWFHCSEQPYLSSKDINDALIKMSKDNQTPAACLTVWEGYRYLMSAVNKRLNAPDISTESVHKVTDKFKMRNMLIAAELSKVTTKLVNKEIFEEIISKKENKFFKPRVGLASFGAFPANQKLVWDNIVDLGKEMLIDEEYQSIFRTNQSSSVDFIVEDFISGIEISFEVMVVDNQSYILALHEKLETKQEEWTLLENSCVSPPIHVSDEEIRDGIRIVSESLKTLSLKTGCYHVEAKFDTKNKYWEIIEINPRVGGSLIKESVKLQTKGICILEMWIESLLAKSPKEITQLAKKLSNIKSSKRTFFRAYFGKPGTYVKEVRIGNAGVLPQIIRVFVKAGSRLPASSREIFLGQALWSVPKSATNQALFDLNHNSSNFLEVACA